MQTQETEKNSGLGAVARQVAEHTSSLFRLELELAQLELKKKVQNLGVGIGLAIAAAVFAFYGLGFLFATIAAGLATAMSTWLAILIVTCGLFVVGAVPFARALIRLGLSFRRNSASSASGCANLAATPPSAAALSAISWRWSAALSTT